MGNVIGYQGIGPEDGVFISIEDAFKVAMERLPHEDEQTKRAFVEWFFSGNFLAVKE